MADRLPKLNKHLQRTLAEVLQTEADISPNVLVTVTRAEVTPNLRSVKMWLSFFPLDEAKKTLDKLEAQIYDIQGAFNRKLEMRPLPRLKLLIDYGPEHAQKMEGVFKKLDTTDHDHHEPHP